LIWSWTKSNAAAGWWVLDILFYFWKFASNLKWSLIDEVVFFIFYFMIIKVAAILILLLPVLHVLAIETNKQVSVGDVVELFKGPCIRWFIFDFRSFFGLELDSR
jgi:hypothetical protein